MVSWNLSDPISEVVKSCVHVAAQDLLLTELLPKPVVGEVFVVPIEVV